MTTLQGATPNTAGIVVLTDGEDSYVSALIERIEIATDLGIRVSFGFLNPSGGVQDPDILLAIDANCGVYSNIDDATAQANFVSLVLASGLVSADTTGTSGETFLFQGLKVSGNASGPPVHQATNTTLWSTRFFRLTSRLSLLVPHRLLPQERQQ